MVATAKRCGQPAMFCNQDTARQFKCTGTCWLDGFRLSYHNEHLRAWSGNFLVLEDTFLDIGRATEGLPDFVAELNRRLGRV
jgi:hypothetical protein